MNTYVINFGFKELYFSELIFSTSYKEIKCPAIGIKVLNFPFSMLKAKGPINGNEIKGRKNAEKFFSNAKSIHFKYDINLESHLQTQSIILKLLDLEGEKMRDIGTAKYSLKDFENITNNKSPIIIQVKFLDQNNYEIGECKVFTKVELKDSKEAAVLGEEELKPNLNEFENLNENSGNTNANGITIKNDDIKLIKSNNTHFCPPPMYFQNIPKSEASKRKKEFSDMEYIKSDVARIDLEIKPKIQNYEDKKLESDYGLKDFPKAESINMKISSAPNPIEIKKEIPMLQFNNNSQILDQLINELIQIREIRIKNKGNTNVINVGLPENSPNQYLFKTRRDVEKSQNSPINLEEEYENDFESIATSRLIDSQINHGFDSGERNQIHQIRKSDNSIVESILSLSQSNAKSAKMIHCFRCGMSFDANFALEHKKRCVQQNKSDTKRSLKSPDENVNIHSIKEEEDNLIAENESSNKGSRRRPTSQSQLIADSRSNYTEDFDDYYEESI